MITLQDLLMPIKPIKIVGNTAIGINNLCVDSRKVNNASAFFAIKGTLSDGHDYIEKAISVGAVAIICEKPPTEIDANITYIVVANAANAAGLMASAFYGYPSQQLKVVGITGTNGKTTTATLLYNLFKGLGYKCGLISTVKNIIEDEAEESTHTTPDAISIQFLLKRMADKGCTHVFMEVSSHAIHQERIAGIVFAGGVFTNITHDHLDYHKTFDEYIRVKKLFFDNLPSTAFALTNADEKRGLVMLQNTKAAKNTYSLKMPATVKGKVLENNLSGLVLNVDGIEAHFRMIGIFNAYNLLAVYGTGILLGEDKTQVLAVLSGLIGAAGRFETYLSPKDKILGIIDYAHTPDALLNVLATINQLRTNGQQLITIIGCGGDRDRSKRPIMAEAACRHSDKIILTSDNPRSEDAEEILNEMEKGLNTAQKERVLRITDRRAAIKTAVMLAKTDDILLVAGKGHETYQEIKGIKHHFDDKEELLESFKTLNR